MLVFMYSTSSYYSETFKQAYVTCNLYLNLIKKNSYTFVISLSCRSIHKFDICYVIPIWPYRSRWMGPPSKNRFSAISNLTRKWKIKNENSKIWNLPRSCFCCGDPHIRYSKAKTLLILSFLNYLGFKIMWTSYTLN